METSRVISAVHSADALCDEKIQQGLLSEKPEGSNSIQSRAIIYQLLLRIQSQEFQAQRIVEVAKRSSRSDNSEAKQLTTYEELSKMDVNC
ncbi:hypothetical protein F511_42681 [Dorcoceras hygrometricum]|uniref:Uncharacterized protein n=1 Tax=Dorcoceras hygrometricum TaxID=472368 RepID=A0A2Z7D002_9LAMI|nr:hypothetical protein F511_42681 [Dorcoceras hygrometricum]